MHKLKFRALNGKGQWFYGINKSTMLVAPVVENSDNHIVSMENFWSLIECGYLKRHTVGQFIGRKDMDGDELYHGDVVKLTPEYNLDEADIAHIDWDDENSGWIYRRISNLTLVNGMGLYIKWQPVKRIGNVWQNPELLELVE